MRRSSLLRRARRGLLFVAGLCAALFLTVNVARADATEVLGAWTTENGKSKVEIYQCREKLCGKIVWLKEPNYVNPAEGTPGTPKLDGHNPDERLRTRPIVGLQILAGFVPGTTDNTWVDGTIYDPESGKTYKCKMRLVSPKRLEIRGFIGIALIGRTAVWTR